MADRNDHYVPDRLFLEGRPGWVEIGPPHHGSRHLARETIGAPDEYNRDTHWRWADVSGDGTHWSLFEGHHVQIDIEFHTENRREVNGWKGRDEIRAEGAWTLALNRQQVWRGLVRANPLDQLLEIRRVAQRLIEHEAIDWRSGVPLAEQFLGRRVYYRETPAVVSSVSCLDQGCVILKPVGVIDFPPAVWSLDRDGEEDAERDEAKADLLCPHVWWSRDKPAGDEEDEAERRRHPVPTVDGSALYASGGLLPDHEERVVHTVDPDDIARNLLAFGAWTKANGIDPTRVARHPITITQVGARQTIHYNELQVDPDGHKIVDAASPNRILTMRRTRTLLQPLPEQLTGGARP